MISFIVVATNFAADPKSEVFAAERGGVVVVFESEKVDQKTKAPKYSMVALGKLDRGYVKGAETKEELVDDYVQLLANDQLSLFEPVDPFMGKREKKG